MKYISIEEYNKLMDELADRIESHETIYGIPKNGSIIAEGLSWRGYKITDNPDKATIFVDDLIDSGKTRDEYLKRYPSKLFLTLIEKNDEWIQFWFEKKVSDDEQTVVTRMLEHIGENPKRTGLQGTPNRVVKMWKEIYKGYDQNQKPVITVFPNGEDGVIYDEMVIDSGTFYSQCEHHMVPFFGQYWFAYIPDKTIIGLSKVARIVDYHSSKLQIQERLVADILNDLETAIKPKGIALIMKGEHLCKTMRGVRKPGKMVTSDLRGVFRTNASARSEFMNFVNGEHQ